MAKGRGQKALSKRPRKPTLKVQLEGIPESRHVAYARKQWQDRQGSIIIDGPVPNNRKGVLGKIKIPDEIIELRDRGALFVSNHSGGKDSQAMHILLESFVPREQLVVVHADLGDVEWDGLKEHIARTTGMWPLVAKASTKDFFDMVLQREMFPSPIYRQCTSDLKTSPSNSLVLNYLKGHPYYDKMVVNCVGLRAEESSKRAKQSLLKVNTDQSIAGRIWVRWLPIHDLSEQDVFKLIEEAGQEPHPIYKTGMKRCSCQFCIMASDSDLRLAATLSPRMYARYVAAEQLLNFTFKNPEKGQRPRFLPDITGINPDAIMLAEEYSKLVKRKQELDEAKRDRDLFLKGKTTAPATEAQLRQRLRTIVEATKRLLLQPVVPDEHIKRLREESRAIAAKLKAAKLKG